MNDIGYQIELAISCRNLKDKDTFSKSDPTVLVYLKRFLGDRIENNWYLIGQTETIKNNLNPNFQKSFTLDYIFEVKQPIKFEVRDIDGQQFEDLGSVESTIGTLFGSKNQTCILDLSIGGKLVALTSRIEVSNEFYTMKWSASNLKSGWCSKPNPQLKIYKVKQTNLFVYETEIIGNSNNPSFKQFTIPAVKLTDLFRIDVFSNSNSIGHALIDIKQIKEGIREFQLLDGSLKLDLFVSETRPSFMEYLQGGLQLNLTLAVDFTGSNGDPTDCNSLHYINDVNEYLSALRTVGEILLAYDYDKLVPSYGFGAKLRYPRLNSQNQTIHCFPMSGDPDDTNALGIQGIEQIYKFALQNVQLSGPTLFGPLISETMKLAKQLKQEESQVYIILLILTDGAIHDMDETLELIEEASTLPMSIIIIGVGEDNFKLMVRLDGDNDHLQMNSVKRDLVQFVPYRNFSSPLMLAKEVLAELPDQLVKYMMMQGQNPKVKQIHLQV